ncbi:MAG: ABC transporter substrate-binding protein [Methanothrix sp.]|nr:ABC transporter substrate-binding protein [Methanothrix sp.]
MKRMSWIRTWQTMMIMLAVLGALFLRAAGISEAAPQGVLKQAIHWGFSADWLDPGSTGYTGAAQLPMYLFYDALLKPMPDGTYTPCLAESYTMSPDAKVYEFKLRRGVKFHNGDPMTAEDVVFSFTRYKAGLAKFIHGKTEKVEAVNPYLVRIQFKEPFPDFLEYFLPGTTTIGWVVPKKYIEKVGDAGFKKNPIGCGPYKFVEFVPGVKLVGEAYEQFWRKVPHIKRLEFHTVLEPATRLAMVKRGEMDVATLMIDVYYQEVKKDPKLRLLVPFSPSQRLVYIPAQWDPKSPWADVRVRKAASLAVDRKTLADIHMPGSGPLGSLGLEGDPFALFFPPDPYDPAGAKKLLAEAGYSKGVDVGKLYPADGGYMAFGEQVATYWKAVGINTEVIFLERVAWQAMREGGKMKDAAFIDPTIAPTIGGRLNYLFSAGNYGNYPDIQALWDKYRKEVSTKVRKELIGRVQTLAHEKTMFIPLTSNNSPAAFGPKVKGNPYLVQPLIWFTAPFEDLELNP